MEVFECIPSDVLCTSDDRHGNFLLAQRTFRPGDIILSSEPFAFALLDHCIKTRCSYCCAKSTALLQCSRCRYTLYCDAHCQKKGWAFHKSECTALSLCLQSAQGGEQLLADLRLVLMTEGAKKSTTHNCSRREDGVSICGGNHCSRLAIGHSFDMSTTRAAAQAIAAITKSNSNSSIDDYKCTIAKFACNNFGLLDELLGCIGAAVSPCVALLNHSCAPSCVLRFDYRRGHAPSIKVVAARTLQYGEELTHAYTELVDPRAARQQKLSSYGFTCKCPRCDNVSTTSIDIEDCMGMLGFSSETGVAAGYNRSVTIPVAFATSGSYDCFLPSRQIKVIGERVSMCVDDAGEARLDNSMDVYQSSLQQAQQLACQGMQSECIEDEIRSLRAACAIYACVCGPFHTELYRTGGLLLSALIIQGDATAATICCLRQVGYLQLMFAAVCPNHPLLGLQLFTLGDLMAASSAPQIDTTHVYKRSRKILAVTHGEQSTLVQRLDDILRKCRNQNT